MNRSNLEDAIVSLNELLSRGDPPEDDCQQWFETHPVVFECLGYSDNVPHPELTSSGVVLFIPDFLVRRADNSLWEIFEIKTPDAGIIKSKKTRKDFYASLSEYIAQCVEYSEYFDDTAHRVEFSQKHGFEVHKSPRRCLVAGSDDGLEQAQVHALLNQRSHSVQLLTYDNIAAKLEFYRTRQSGGFERLQGFSIHLLIRAERLVGEENFILDVGAQPEKNRVSLYVDVEDHLCFRLIDRSGNPQQIRLPTGVDSIAYDEWKYVIVEGGIGDDFTYLAVDVDGRNCFHVQLPGLKVEVFAPHCVVGSDISGQANSKFSIKTILIMNRTLTFEERHSVRSEILDMGRSEEHYLEFADHRFGFTEHHPLWVSNTSEGRSNYHFGALKQPDPARQPWFVGPTGRRPMTEKE